MPTTIKLKNSVTTTNAPSSLVQGEVAINITDKKVWVGNAATTPVQLLGTGADVSFTNLAYTGTLTGGTGVVNIGSGQFYKAAGGDIGIGLTAINSTANYRTLEISGTNGAFLNFSDDGVVKGSIYGNSGGLTLNAFDSNNIDFWTNSTQKMRLNGSGNLAIGNNSPSALLSVGTAVSNRGGASTYAVVANKTSAATVYSEIQSATDGTGGLLFSDGSTGNYGLVDYAHSTDMMKLFTGGSARISIDSTTTTITNNVLVGAGTSQGPLTIYSAGGSQLFLQKAGAAPSLAFGSTTNYSFIMEAQAASGVTFYNATGTYASPTLTTVFAISSAGVLAFNSGYGSAANAYGCRAWVNFNGTGTVAIRQSGNVSSITDNGTGDYTINFTNAMPDANYSIVTANRYYGSGYAGSLAIAGSGTTATPLTTSSARMLNYLQTGGAGSVYDVDILCASIFR